MRLTSEEKLHAFYIDEEVVEDAQLVSLIKDGFVALIGDNYRLSAIAVEEYFVAFDFINRVHQPFCRLRDGRIVPIKFTKGGEK